MNLVDSLFVYEKVWEKLIYLSRKRLVYETGGILLGLKKDELPIISKLVEPGPASEGSYFTFNRDTDFITTVLAETIVETKGSIDFIGEWYIKPSNFLQPTAVENRQMLKICNNPKFNNKNPVLLLCNHLEKGFRAKAFVYSNNHKPKNLKINIVKELDNIE